MQYAPTKTKSMIGRKMFRPYPIQILHWAYAIRPYDETMPCNIDL